MTPEERCRQTIYTGTWSRRSQCSKRGTVTRYGALFCSIHDPVNVAKRDTAKRARWEAEDKLRKAKWGREKAIFYLCLNVDTDVIQQLGEGWLANHLAKTPAPQS